MTITPQDINTKTFSKARRDGYAPDEVDVFLEQVAGDMDAMIRKIADLKTRLSQAEAQIAAAESEPRPASIPVVAQPTEATPTYNNTITATEKQLADVLITARQSADRMISDARLDSDRIKHEAESKARDIIRQVNADKQVELEEIDRLKQSREDFRNDYMRLVQHFMDEAEATFPEQLVTTTPSGSEAPSRPAPRNSARSGYVAPSAPKGAADETVMSPAATPFGMESESFDLGDLD